MVFAVNGYVWLQPIKGNQKVKIGGFDEDKDPQNPEESEANLDQNIEMEEAETGSVKNSEKSVWEKIIRLKSIIEVLNKNFIVIQSETVLGVYHEFDKSAADFATEESQKEILKFVQGLKNLN